jgi:hypothetical protein
MSILDASLLLRDGATALDANELTPTSVDFGGPDQHPITYVLIAPALATGTSPTLDVTLEESDDNSTWRQFANFAPQLTDANTPEKQFVTAKSDARYRRYTATLSGTTPDFGAVIIGAVIGGQYEEF